MSEGNKNTEETLQSHFRKETQQKMVAGILITEKFSLYVKLYVCFSRLPFFMFQNLTVAKAIFNLSFLW